MAMASDNFTSPLGLNIPCSKLFMGLGLSISTTFYKKVNSGWINVMDKFLLFLILKL